MATLQLKVPDKLEQDFREKAMKRFGYSKGSLSEAGTEALKEWVEKR